MRLFQWTSHHVRAVTLLVAAFSVMGIAVVLRLPVAIFPNLSIPRIIIAAEGGDAPSQNVLVGVTKPLEETFSTIPGLRLVQSQTVRGAAGFTLTFADGTDMSSTLQIVQARIAELHGTLPPDVHVTAERLNPTVFPILDYSLTSKSRSLAELRNLALYVLRPRIARVPGVARVLVNGGDIKEMLVTAKPEQLAAHGINLSQIEDAITKSNTINAVGSYEFQYQRQQVLVSGLLSDADSVKRVVVAVKNRIPITVGDVANVEETIQRKTVIATGGGREAVLLNIVRQPEGNTVQVARDVADELRRMKAELPNDVILAPFYDQSEIVGESAVSVVEAIAAGGFLALLVITGFLRNVRSAIVALSLLPLTLLITFVVLRQLGMSLNIMTLGALAVALGLVIDDSIVVVEHIWQKLEQGVSRLEAARDGLHEITPAMFASSLATIVVFMPLVLLPGITGDFFAPLAKTMIATLVISLILSLTVIPLLALCLFPIRATGMQHHRPITTVLYHRVLRIALRAKWLTILLLVPLIAIAAILYRQLETGFMPEFDEGAFVIDYKMPAGTSITETDRVMRQVEGILGETEGVLTWSRLTGALSGSGLEIAPMNVGDLLVRLKRGKRAPADEIIDDVRKDIQRAVPNLQVDIKPILGDLIGDLAGSPSPIEVKIYGRDISQLKNLAHEVGKRITSIKGVVDEADGITESGPETLVMVDPLRAAELGLSTDTVTSSTEGALEGDLVGSIRKGEILEPIRVRYPYNRESSQEEVSKLQIVSPTGQAVPLESVAGVTVQEGSAELDRENQRLMDSVTARLEGVDLGSGIAAVRSKLADLALPPGYSIEYGGLYKSQQESFAALGAVLATASALVFTVLLFTFRSYRVAAALFIAAVLALIGVVLALFITKTPLNISSYTGAIMIVGIVTENGVLLFDEFRRLYRSEPDESADALLARAGVARVRPILMTTFAAILTLLPLAAGFGAGAAMQKPLAVAVIGGLSLSTLFTLIVAPVLYSTFGQVKAAFARTVEG